MNDPGPSFRSLTNYVQKQQTQSESGDKKDKHEGDPPQKKARTADELLCKICFARAINSVMVPCGHIVCCSRRGDRCRECPICKDEDSFALKTFTA